MPNWLGDAVMSTPLLELLMTNIPSPRICLIAQAHIAELFINDKRIYRIFIDDTKRSFCRLRATWQLGRAIHDELCANDEVIDYAITLTNHLYSAILLCATKARMRIGYAKGLRNIFLTHALAKLDAACDTSHSTSSHIGNSTQASTHQVIRYAHLLSVLFPLLDIASNAYHVCSPPPLALASSHILASSAMHLNAKRPSNPPTPLRIGLNPGAAYGSAKCWHKEGFAQVGAHFAKLGAEILLYGTASDANLANEIITLAMQHGALRHAFTNRCGQTSLQDLITELLTLHLFITNDSGSMHVAAALNTPIIALFGPTNAQETAPWKAQHCTILNIHALCAPCKKRVCPLLHHECMKGITPAMVIEASSAMLARTSSIYAL